MRVIVLIFTFLTCLFNSQTTLAQADSSEIFKVVDQMPLFPGCAVLEGADEQRKCSDKALLEFVYRYLIYPDTALKSELEGTVVVNFVVEKDGSISNANLLKDIGLGCGEEALRVVSLLNEMDSKWSPGKQGGAPVRVYYNLPIRYKIPREPEFYVDGRDTIWVKYDQAPVFEGGMEALDSYLLSNLKYPEGGMDTCAIGIIECSTLVRENGQVVVLETKDYNNLGFDYEYEASRTIISSMAKWTPAKYKGRSVTSAYDIRLAFKPNTPACKGALDNFTKSYELVDEGIKLYQEKSVEQAVEKYNAALALFPQNAEFLLLRGQAFIDLRRIDEACADLTQVKRRLIKTVYNDIIPLICN